MWPSRPLPSLPYFNIQLSVNIPTLFLTVPPTVVYNDATDVQTLLGLLEQHVFDNIVISPGPGTPAAAGDVGLCLALIKAQPSIPILGVCLGFQSIALAYGAPVLRAAEPVHGRLSAIAHTSHPLFKNIPSGEAYQVVRYHSLIVEEADLPEELEAIAWTTGGGHHALGIACTASTASTAALMNGNDSISSGKGANASILQHGVLMGIAHKNLPYYGVQYHPESIGTVYGTELLQNFKDLTMAYYHQSNNDAMPESIKTAGSDFSNGAVRSVPLPFKTETYTHGRHTTTTTDSNGESMNHQPSKEHLKQRNL